MTDEQPREKAYEPLPCPFCGLPIKHLTSLTRSFKPPRIYHEYHHPLNGCVLYHPGPLESFGDDADYTATPRADWIKKWNTRAPAKGDTDERD